MLLRMLLRKKKEEEEEEEEGRGMWRRRGSMLSILYHGMGNKKAKKSDGNILYCTVLSLRTITA